jgi:hypothetical protein
MSGGHFDYRQYNISMLVDEIEREIENNHELGPEVIQKFRDAVDCLNNAYIYVQRIDWLLSGDDGEDSFLRRLEQELSK